jgi:hypothetical protein
MVARSCFVSALQLMWYGSSHFYSEAIQYKRKAKNRVIGGILSFCMVWLAGR